MKRPALLALALFVMSAGPALACLWDYDTLAVERKRFPSTLELITGKFLRHSEAYYKWRVQDRLARLENSPADFRLTDDLCVAYDKLGEHDKAIALMKEQLAAEPERYESHANLGTFLIHNGQLEEGVKYIESAIELNPDAHFGREIYQAHLVRYLLSKGYQPGETLSLPLDQPSETLQVVGFAKFLYEQMPTQTERDGQKAIDKAGLTGVLEQLTERDSDLAAIKGITGMMRFGKHDSPILLEALGDLLIAGLQDDAKRLAARAYLKASYEVSGDARDKFREKAKKALAMQVAGRGSTQEIGLASIETLLKRELENADEWSNVVFADEAAWISQGIDVDAAFTKKYYEEPSVYSPKLAASSVRPSWMITIVATLIALVVLSVIFAWFIARSIGPRGNIVKPAK